MVDFDHTERGNSKSSRTRSCLLWGCGFSIVALLIAVGAFWSLFHYGRSEVAPTVEKFLELMDQQEYEQAYGMVGSKYCGKCGSPIDPLADRKPPIG